MEIDIFILLFLKFTEKKLKCRWNCIDPGVVEIIGCWPGKYHHISYQIGQKMPDSISQTLRD